MFLFFPDSIHWRQSSLVGLKCQKTANSKLKVKLGHSVAVEAATCPQCNQTALWICQIFFFLPLSLTSWDGNASFGKGGGCTNIGCSTCIWTFWSTSGVFSDYYLRLTASCTVFLYALLMTHLIMLDKHKNNKWIKSWSRRWCYVFINFQLQKYFFKYTCNRLRFNNWGMFIWQQVVNCRCWLLREV